MFFDDVLKISGNLNFSLHVGADILNLLFLFGFFIFFHVYYILSLIKKGTHTFYINNHVAKAPGFNLGKNISNLLSNHEAQNQ